MTSILILDGGLGTTLERNHNRTFSSEKTPLWSSDLLVTDPSVLQACQQSFVDAGADIIETSTYQVSVKGFSDTKNDNYPNGIGKSDIPQFIERAVKIAESAESNKTDKHKIALSIGPYGACLIPSQEYSGNYGDLSEEGLKQWHEERLGLFSKIENAAKRVSFIAVETIPKVAEIKSLRRSLSNSTELNQIPYWVSCLYPNEDLNLPSGESADEALRAILVSDYGQTPWGVGINCTKVHKLKDLINEYIRTIETLLREGIIAEWPALVLYPDGTNGEVYNTTTQLWELPKDSNASNLDPWPVQVAKIVKVEQARGTWKAIVVGGCCCTDPYLISELRKQLSP